MSLLEKIFAVLKIKALEMSPYPFDYKDAAELADKEGMFNLAMNLYAKECSGSSKEKAIKLAKRNSMEEKIPEFFMLCTKYCDSRREKEMCLEAAAWYARKFGMIKEAKKYENKYQKYAGNKINYDCVLTNMLYGAIPEENKDNS